VIGSYTMASSDDVERAIDSASKAQSAWKKSGAVQRSDLLCKIALEMRADRERLATQITSELGKPYSEAQKGSRCRGRNVRMGRRRSPPPVWPRDSARTPGIQQIAQLEPVGVVGGFAGWNAPAITPSRKISAALAAGCAIVIKPSEETAGVALLIAQACQRAGTPAGLVNMVFGNPAQIADQLCNAPDIAMITFTGGTEVGRQLGPRPPRR
jgi:succinate-semialdehyde dehydrogenase/glutarate-semialdehyde dehydrogenase